MMAKIVIRANPKAEKSEKEKIIYDVVVGVAIAVIVCIVTYGLRWMDNSMIREIIAIEDTLFDDLVGRPITMAPWASPVVFVDIDQAAIDAVAHPDANFGETPRALVASLITTVSQAGAAVIYVDLDLRGQSTESDKLAEAVKGAKPTHILLPSFFATGLLSPCKSQAQDSVPREMGYPFADFVDKNLVELVHPVVSIGAYALIEGVCSSYDVLAWKTKGVTSRKAAMVAAVDDMSNHAAVDEQGRRHVLPSRWIAGPSDQLIYDSTGRLAYAHVRAGLLTSGDQGLLGSGHSLDVFRRSIVIIGSSHDSAGDVQPSPYGGMPGALVQANIGLTLELAESDDPSWTLQFVLDLFLLFVSSATSLVLYNVVKNELVRSLSDLFITIFIGITATVLLITVQRSYGALLAGWRFGLLSCLTGGLAVFFIQLTNLIANIVARHLPSFFTR